MSETIGLIGAGHIGSTLARLSIDAGYRVILSNSRDPETLAPLVAALGAQARAATPSGVAEEADLVIVTVPLFAYRHVPVAPLAGKVVIDTNNYYPDRDGIIPELDAEATTTSELLQAHLPESSVVKAFNNIYYTHLGRLGRPRGDEQRSSIAIAGDSSEAKARVSRFIDRLGFDTLDVGPLSEGWRFQRDLPAYSVPYIGSDGQLPAPDGDFNPGQGIPAGREKLARALAAARRYSELQA